MGVIEQFVVFAETLSDDRRREIEEILESIMESDSAEFVFTDEELEEIDRRLADPNPQYADPAEIEAIFRRFDKA